MHTRSKFVFAFLYSLVFMGMLTPGSRVPSVSMSLKSSVYMNVIVSVADYNTAPAACFRPVLAASIEGILMQLL